MNSGTPPLLGFCAWSGTGKTTLLARLIPLLKKKDLRIGVVKHAHHDFDIDHPGKDSYVLRDAGAEQVLVASHRRMAWIREISEGQEEPSLQDALAAMDLDKLDLVLVEGFKHESFNKIELHRSALGKPLLYPEDRNIMAVATDGPVDKPSATTRDIHVLDINRPDQVADFIIASCIRV